MGYYYCKKCEKLFKTKHREIPEQCPQCQNIHNITQIQKMQYEKWKEIQHHTELYKILKQKGMILT